MSRAPYHREIELSDDPVAVNEQKIQHQENVRANEAFVALMMKAIKRGKESVEFGVTIDRTEPIYHRRLYGEAPRSSCGSPAAMCIESAVQQDGAATMK